MSEVSDSFTALYSETAAYGLLTNRPMAGYVQFTGEVPGVDDETLETIVYATSEPPSVTHVHYNNDPFIVAATVLRASKVAGEIAVERGAVYCGDELAIDMLADTQTRYEQTINTACMTPVAGFIAAETMADMTENTGALFLLTQS